MEAAWSRRAFLYSLPAVSLSEILPSEIRRFRDAATEFEVIRLTDPQWTSRLPPAHLRPVSRDNQLLFCSDRGSGVQAFRLDLGSGAIRAVSGPGVDVATLSFTPDDSRIIYFENGVLTTSNPEGGRRKILYKLPSGWALGNAFSLSGDGRDCAWVESRDSQTRVRMTATGRSSPSTAVESDGSIRDVLLRPRRRTILIRSGESSWLIGYNGRDRKDLKLAPDPSGPMLWTQDGRSLLYLAYPEGRLNQLREHFPDTGEDKLIAPTSQFVSFARNSNGSVFAGISRNQGSPYVLLLLRVTRREFTLCEHRATDPSRTPIVFSPNSQRVFFETDRHGKPVIYSMAIERLVETTESE